MERFCWASVARKTRKPPSTLRWMASRAGGGAEESNSPVQSRSTRDVLQAYSVLGISRCGPPPTGTFLRQPSDLLRTLLDIRCAASQLSDLVTGPSGGDR